MASISTTGLDEAITELSRMAHGMGDCCSDMVEAAGRVIIDSWVDTGTKRGLIDSGAMLASVDQVTGHDDAWYTEVYPQGSSSAGKHKKAVRNAEKAFVLNYKPGKGSGWVNEAEEKCKDDAVAAAESVYMSYRFN